MVATLVKRLGTHGLEEAEDIVADVFMHAQTAWETGLPENPKAWLYHVAKQRALDGLRRKKTLHEKVEGGWLAEQELSDTSIEATVEQSLSLIPEDTDNLLQMLFAVCHPAIAQEGQVALALRTLCGLGIEEIAEVFLTNKETVNKRLHRARERFRAQGLALEMPPAAALKERLGGVMQTLYLLFTNGHYSTLRASVLQRSICEEAIRLGELLAGASIVDSPEAEALVAMMWLHSSRLEARIDQEGNTVGLLEQSKEAWDATSIDKGKRWLDRSARGEELSAFHLEAIIALLHTQPDSRSKWDELVGYHTALLSRKPSSWGRLNLALAMQKAGRIDDAVSVARSVQGLEDSHFYHAVMAELLRPIDAGQARQFLERALRMAPLEAERRLLAKGLSAWIGG